MEEPIQIKTEPIEFQSSYCLQSSEPTEPQIKSEPMEFQSACSIQSSENNDVSTKQYDYITDNMDSQQPYPVMLHFAGSYELLPSNSMKVTNEKEISDTHLSEAAEGLIKSELSDCDTEIVKAEEEFPSDKHIFNTSYYYGKDNHACHIMRSSEDEIIQIENKLPVAEIGFAPDNDIISGKDINANVKPNGLHDNHVGIKLIDRNTPSLLGGNSVASAVMKSQKTSENAPLFGISVTKKSNPHLMVFVLKLPFQNNTSLFGECYESKAARSDHSYSHDLLKGVKNDHTYNNIISKHLFPIISYSSKCGQERLEHSANNVNVFSSSSTTEDHWFTCRNGP